MNIGHVGNQGGVDRGADRPARVDGRRGQTAPASAPDQAAISDDGREAAATFSARVAGANAEPAERPDRVARAMTRLMSGDLDKAEVLRETAEKMLAKDFRTI